MDGVTAKQIAALKAELLALEQQWAGTIDDGQRLQLQRQIEKKSSWIADLEGRQTPNDFSDPLPSLRDWVGRSPNLAEIQSWLAAPNAPLLWILAPGGYGKSTLAARAFAENVTERKCWINLNDRSRDFLNLAARLLGRSPVDANAITELVLRLEQERWWLAIDNFESLLDADENWIDPLWESFLRAWLDSNSQSKILITTRERPHGWNEGKLLNLGGLTAAEGVAFWQQKQVGGAPAQLEAVVTQLGGVPLALRFAADWLVAAFGEGGSVARLAELSSLFDLAGRHQRDTVSVDQVFLQSYGRLKPEQQQVLAAVCVLRGGFAPQTVAQLTGQPEPETKEHLHQLRRRAFVDLTQDEGKYVLQPFVAQLVQRQVPDLAAQHRRAIAHYETLGPAKLLPTDAVGAAAPYAEMAHHRCELGEYGAAFEVLQQEIFTDPYGSNTIEQFYKFRGGFGILLETYSRIVREWHPQPAGRQTYANTLRAIGDVLQFLDRRDEALERYEAALQFYRPIGDRLGEANVLCALGNLKANPAESMVDFLAAQEIYVAIGDLYSEGRNLRWYIIPALLKCDRPEEARLGLQRVAAIGTAISYQPYIDFATSKLAEL
ncbi:MAG: hypothetical protein HC918_04790 [Oscillatoriales cyanobacterium SM2_1_8]|nr:hypothetical protein [Oscillatoriales cyanobacterium SM2_1_8]